MSSFWMVFLFLGLCFINFGEISANIVLNNACTVRLSYPGRLTSPYCYYDPNVRSNVVNIVQRSGYQIEVHGFISSDGVIMKLFRIKSPKVKGDQPVYIQHGINADSAPFVNHGKRSLAFALADAGYDVWLGNLRGTTYSREHVSLSPNSKEFWNFNLDKLAAVDIRESLLKIANITGKAGQIIYIGHSMGTTVSYLYASSHPEESSKILKGIISLSPVAYVDDVKLLKLSGISQYSGLLRSGLKIVHLRGLFLPQDLVLRVSTTVCGFIPHLCKLYNKIVFGDDDGQLAVEEELLYFGNWPIAAAVDVYIQYLQIAKTKSLTHFDFGSIDNKKMYGNSKAPVYDLGKIKLPVYLFYGLNDLLTPVPSLMRLYNELGSSKKGMVEISKDGKIKFNHLDFMYAKDADVLLNPEILKVLKDNLSP